MEDNNNFFIDLDIYHMEDLYNKYNHAELSVGFCHYLEREITKASVRNKIVIRISLFAEFPKEKCNALVDAIRSHYGHNISEITYKNRSKNTKNLILILAGILFVIFSELSIKINIFLLTELLSVIGGVAIWQIISQIIFTDTEKRLELNRSKQLANSKVVFNKAE
jgi:hypothetical protein